MFNIILGIFVGMNLVFMECLIAYGLLKKNKTRLVKNKLNIK